MNNKKTIEEQVNEMLDVYHQFGRERIEEYLKENPDMRLFVVYFGTTPMGISMPKVSCAFCKHCYEIFYDYDGPYEFKCELTDCENHGSFEECDEVKTFKMIDRE